MISDTAGREDMKYQGGVYMKAVPIVKETAVIAVSAIYMISAAPISVYAEKPDFNVQVHTPPHIVFMGDSIASGYGLDAYSPDDKTKCASYANILSKVFDSELPEEASFGYDNLAKDGLTSKGLLKKLKDGEMDEYLAEADAVVISIGGNDLLGPLEGLIEKDIGLGETLDRVLSLEDTLDEHLDTYKQNLPAIVDEIYDRTKKEDFTLFIQTLYNPLEDFALTPIANMSKDKIGDLNRIITAESDNDTRFRVIDVATPFVGRAEELTNIKSYDIHPNSDGHALIAKTAREVIEKETFTYYDNEAAMQYNIEQEQLRQLEKERQERRQKIIMTGSGAAGVLAISFGAISVFRKKRH